jgi:phosphatidate cytidylyltransferase
MNEIAELLGAVGGALTIATVIGWILARRAQSDSSRNTIANLNARIRAWWVMVAVLAAGLLAGLGGTVLLFAFISFLALREFITLTPTHRADHRLLFWVFFVFTPLQYWLIWRDWYSLFAILIPVYAFLYIPVRIAIEGDTRQFLERAAKIQWGLMICVYCLSHAPAMLLLKIEGYRDPVRLLLFFLIVVQSSDVFQYVWGKLFGKKKIAPDVSPSKTWAGFIGGSLTSIALGGVLKSLTPFNLWQTLAMSAVAVLLGFFGGLTMSAIKRDRGVKDYGTLIAGHGGVMDRIDSICFAAPVFFHITRYYFTKD